MTASLNPALTLREDAPTDRAAALVCKLLQSLRGGRLELRLPDGTTHVFGDGERLVHLQVHDASLFSQVLARGDLGLAEAYLDGHWDSPDLTALMTLLADNRSVLRRAVYGSWWGLLVARLRHWRNRNTRSGSQRNIMAHYDLGNDFYRLWLDPSMSYSSGIYRAQDDGSLLSAQHAKYRRILSRLGARPGQRVLEIGCGWGGFAEMAQQDGLQVTGLTLSPAQLAWARQRVPQADLRLQDYRDTTERFDHIVSIEMIEAVGERWWPGYFKTLARSLAPGGRAVIQSITIRDDLFAAYRKGTDFIQQHVFPGGMLPSRGAVRAAAARQGLVVTEEFAFGIDYARTLSEWRQAFDRNWSQIAAQGFDPAFRRLWHFYLAYCEAGFRAGNVDVVQFELAHR